MNDSVFTFENLYSAYLKCCFFQMGNFFESGYLLKAEQFSVDLLRLIHPTNLSAKGAAKGR